MIDISIVLAAGKGTRMRSSRPKVLHRLLGRPLLSYVLDVAGSVAERLVVVVAPEDTEVAELAGKAGAATAVQGQRLGTAHAVGCALDLIGYSGTALVLCGDTPLLQPSTLAGFARAHGEARAAMSVLSAYVADPFGYGRIVRRAGCFSGIVEEKDATPEERAIKEINTGVYIFDLDFLRSSLPKVGRDNRQGEYYLTDLAAIGLASGARVEAFPLAEPWEVLGVNDRAALSQAEQTMLNSIRRRWMEAGVTFLNAPTVYVEPTVELSPDVEVGPGAVLKGHTVVGAGATIGAHAVLESVKVEPGEVVPPMVVRKGEESYHE